ncbi:MAG: hypothetical protein ACYDCN_14815 [Bacteroidia bacterium]
MFLIEASKVPLLILVCKLSFIIISSYNTCYINIANIHTATKHRGIRQIFGCAAACAYLSNDMMRQPKGGRAVC